MKNQKKLGLSLRGGGARCASYLGVIKALEENDIEIHAIVGASGGALSGGAYAAGVSYDDNLQNFINLTPSKIMGLDSITDVTLASDDMFIKYAEDFVGDMRIEETKIPFYPQLTDYETGEVVYLEKGPLARAAVASSAAPGFMKPIEVEGRKYMDGDVSGGFSAEFLRSKGMEVVIAMSTSPYDHYQVPNNIINKFIHPMNIMAYRIKTLDLKINPVDILLDNLAIGYSFLENKKSREIAEHGYKIAMNRMSEIKELVF